MKELNADGGTGMIFECPPFQTNDRMEAILNEVEPLDERLDQLRVNFTGLARASVIDEIRNLRSQISTLMVEYYQISAEVNADYYRYWRQEWQRREQYRLDLALARRLQA